MEHLAAKDLPSHRMATVDELYNHTLFWRSDNSRFWFYNDDKGFHTFKAVTLSDTGRVEIGFNLTYVQAWKSQCEG